MAVADGAPDTVFFLSDYGLRDGFVGVVHAVLRQLAPSAAVIDLTHEVSSFDVRAGAAALVRAVPYLGAGVVLSVVDPGVGGGRRGLVARAADSALWLVGPDNGLLVPALELLGGSISVFELPGRGSAATGPGPSSTSSVTFDGRDVLAPAAAALCRGEPASSLGTPVDPSSLVRLPDPVVEQLRLPDGHLMLRAEVTWVDRFGNVQLAAGPGDLPTGLSEQNGQVEVAEAGAGEAGEARAAGSDDDRAEPSVTVAVESGASGVERLDGPLPARCVRTFSDLEVGELGLLADSNGRMALVVCEDSASARLGALAGDLVELVW